MKSGWEALRSRLRRYRWTLVAGGAAALVLYHPWLPSPVERLCETSPGRGDAIVGFRDGLYLMRRPDVIALDGKPVRGGPRRVLVPPVPAPRPIESVEIEPDRVRFFGREPVLVRASGTKIPSLYRLRVWEAEFGGGPPREIVQEAARLQIGDLMFALRPQGPPKPAVQMRDGHFTQPVAPCDVVAEPIAGGTTRFIARGVPSNVQLDRLGRGISWSVSADAEKAQSDLYFALPPDFKLRIVRNCASRPVLAGDRLYWIDREYSVVEQGVPTDNERMELLTARLDGSDRITVADLQHEPEWEPGGHLLGAYRGDLYAVLFTRSPISVGSRAGTPTLCRVRPDGIEKLFALPGEPSQHWFDGDHLYFSISETRESWNLSTTMASVFYRARLP